MELYYAIVNIIDYYAKKDKKLNWRTVGILTSLAETENIKIEDVASANDCPICTTWEDLRRSFADLYKKGERI